MNRIGPTRLKILGVLLAAQYSHRPSSIRELAKVLHCQLNTVEFHLKALRNAGLVTWTYGQYRTLRPTVEFIPV